MFKVLKIRMYVLHMYSITFSVFFYHFSVVSKSVGVKEKKRNELTRERKEHRWSEPKRKWRWCCVVWIPMNSSISSFSSFFELLFHYCLLYSLLPNYKVIMMARRKNGKREIEREKNDLFLRFFLMWIGWSHEQVN